MNQDLINYAFAGEDFSKPYTLAEAATFFHGRNILNLGELAEQAISKKIKIGQQTRNKEGSDLLDGTEIKYSIVQFYTSSTYATIGNVKNKTGTIRAWVYEERTKKNHYFLIPYSVYSQYFEGGKKSTMKVWFDSKGKPRTPKFNTNPNLWECRVTKQKFFSFKQK